MPPFLVTSCSSRKSVPHGDRLHAADLLRGSLAEVGSTWRAWLKDHHCKKPARDMYNGRGFFEAKTAAEVTGAEHWIVSAGLGLIPESEQIPGYDLTVSGNGINQISRKILGDTFTAQAWWNELAKRKKPYRTLTRLVEANPSSTFILALPSNYLTMVLQDLEQLSAKARRRLRIIGPPKKAVPTSLQPFWLPYDQRLDGPDSPIPGTRSDFPQRAARHFLESIWPATKGASAKAHAQTVDTHLKPLSYPVIPKRKQLDDEELIGVIRDLWTRADGKSSLMLRLLRDEELIACEQGRFKSLFHQAKQHMEAA